nr:hypothetical protein [Mycoplasma haemofelis]
MTLVIWFHGMEGSINEGNDLRCSCGWYCGRNKGYFHKLHFRSKVFTVKMFWNAFRIDCLKRWNAFKQKFFELVED